MSSVRAKIGYSERTEKRPYFYANAHEKDFVPLAPVEVEIADARGLDCTLKREGFTLVTHKSVLDDLTDLKAVAEVHRGEIAELLRNISGCDEVMMTPISGERFATSMISPTAGSGTAKR